MRRSPQSPRTPRAGFTLLEVLAAVAVLALTYSMLATAAMQGLRAEGDATRRMRASMLADQRITELEVQVAMGQAPDLGTHESQEEDFLVTTEVKPLDLVIADTKASKKAQDRLERAVGAGKDKGKETPSFLKPAASDKQSMLRRIDLKVSWAEGESEQIVTRSTFALDTVAAAPLIEILVAAAEAEKTAAGAANATKNGAQNPTPDTSANGASNSAQGKNAQQLRASEGNSSSSMGSSKSSSNSSSSSSSSGSMKRSTQGVK